MAQYTQPNYAIIKVKRSEVQPGDEILGPAPRHLPLAIRPRPRYLRRTSSLDRDDFRPPAYYRDRGAIARRRQEPSDSEDQYDSEASIPPRSRRQGPGRQNNRNQKGQQQRGQQSNHNGKGSSSSESDSDLGCTDDDEKLKKKARLKKWGAIGLAGVATIHAVHGVKETVEKTKERNKELDEGEISESEAAKKRKKARWRNAADVGIAGIWIKSAYDEMKEYREARNEHLEACERTEERHKKRMERAKAIKRGEYKGHHGLAEDELKKFVSDDDDGRRR